MVITPLLLWLVYLVCVHPWSSEDTWQPTSCPRSWKLVRSSRIVCEKKKQHKWGTTKSATQFKQISWHYLRCFMLHWNNLCTIFWWTFYIWMLCDQINSENGFWIETKITYTKILWHGNLVKNLQIFHWFGNYLVVFKSEKNKQIYRQKFGWKYLIWKEKQLIW